jgi:pyruvate dehydrogenase E1 component beta subunit
MVIRIPFAGGIGGVEHHCDSSEAYYAHTPGLKVVAPGTVSDAYSLLRAAIADPDPVIFLEPKRLYFARDDIELTAGPPLGVALVRRAGRDATVVAYGPSVKLALEAAEVAAENQLQLEVVDLRSIVPFDENTVMQSVRKTGRCIVIHESHGFAGVGAEISARIHERCFHYLQAPVLRVSGLDIPYPAPRLEEFYLPSVDRVLDAVDRLQWHDTPDVYEAVNL